MKRRQGLTTHKHESVISLRILTHIAWENIINKKLRSFLTIFGVVIGIGAIFFLLSLGLGLRNLVADQIIGDQSIKSIDVTSSNSKVLKLNPEVATQIQQFAHVETVGKMFSFPGTILRQGGESDAVTYGVDEQYQKLANIVTVSGRQLTKSDTNAVLVNRAALKTLGFKDDADALKKSISINVPLKNSGATKSEIRNEFAVVGIIDSGTGSEIYIPSALFEVAGVPNYSQLKVLADNSDNVDNLRKQIESRGFQTTSAIDTLSEINQVFKFFTAILVGFGSVGMAVSVLGMFNTLTISLLERTKEIGLMIALGARNRDMKRLFTIEAMLLSVAGAVIGIALAMVAGFIINILMNQLAQRRGVTDSFSLFSTPAWAILLLIVFMMLVGLLVVFFPARRAQKINPIDALRRE